RHDPVDAGNETSSLSVGSRSSAAAGAELSVVEASARAHRLRGVEFYPRNCTRFRDFKSGGNPTFADGVADKIGRVMHVQLLHEAPAMEFGGFYADMQNFGNLLSRLPFAHELQHLTFAGGEMRARTAIL